LARRRLAARPGATLRRLRFSRTRGIFVTLAVQPDRLGHLDPRKSAALFAFARRRGLWLVADEVYGRIVYGNRKAPFLLDQAEPEDRLIAVNSFFEELGDDRLADSAG